MRKQMSSAVAAVLLLSWPARAEIIYVKADATRQHNGESWADAYTDLQDAFAEADSGDQIWGAAQPDPPLVSRPSSLATARGDLRLSLRPGGQRPPRRRRMAVNAPTVNSQNAEGSGI